MKKLNKKGQAVIVALLWVVAEYIIFFIGYPALSDAIDEASANITDPILLLVMHLSPFLILGFISLQLFFVVRYGGA